MPVLSQVAELQQELLRPEHKDFFAVKWNWADAFLAATLGEASPRYRFLRQALMARRALLLLDGMDEGGRGKAQIERHVKEVLLPQGHAILLTSRPDSVVPEVYSGCQRLCLCPLTEAQQRKVIHTRLRGLHLDPDALAEYVQRLPPGVDGVHVAGNPLILAMLISIYEARQPSARADKDPKEPPSGRDKPALVPMPANVTDVYARAAAVLLSKVDGKARGGGGGGGGGGDGGAGEEAAAEAGLRPLLHTVALEAHAAAGRLVTGDDLKGAVLRLQAWPPSIPCMMSASPRAPGPRRLAPPLVCCPRVLPPAAAVAAQVSPPEEGDGHWVDRQSRPTSSGMEGRLGVLGGREEEGWGRRHVHRPSRVESAVCPACAPRPTRPPGGSEGSARASHTQNVA